ncbi:hypothetical protein CFC21_048378 [Triticum aestivum]|nr:uncharacterized protein LOC109749587 [Aegilops tauschii subsp. strangulata]XP_044353537.1 uncharacterized protein LOC123074869 [Triticum aestivum]KAF7038171.1 hypothetical protein CFC21_048378 [Triticum aestivum]
MGNCAITHQATSWADDGEWELPSPGDEDEGQAEQRKEHVSEVTIRISKRQLQELVDKRADDGVWKGRRSASELLTDIMNAGEVHHHVDHCRAAHWKPALQSIPEAVES